MPINPEVLVNKSPKELFALKQNLLDQYRFEDAMFVAYYINHCVVTNRIIKETLKG